MVRPKKTRFVAFNPDISYFKPRGIPMSELEEVRLTIDERESVRLADLMGMSYEDAGKQMGVSRATFGRIIQNTRKIIADALINGKAIHIQGGSYALTDKTSEYMCNKCKHRWEGRSASEPENCPTCKHEYFQRIA